jgi:hypothetical protein
VITVLALVVALPQSSGHWVKKIGGCTIEHTSKQIQQYLSVERVVIRDQRHKLVADIQDEVVGLTWTKDLNKDGVPEIDISSYTGGAHCCEIDWVFSLGARPSCMLEFAMGNSVDFQPKDLDQDGKFEIQTAFDGYAYYKSSYADSAWLPMIFKVKGTRLVEATPYYRKETMSFFKDSVKGLDEALKVASGGSLFASGPSAGPAVQVLASGILAHRGDYAWTVLLSKLTPGDSEKLRKLEPEIRTILANRVDLAKYPKLPVISHTSE